MENSTGQQVSKNIVCGEPIPTYNEIQRLAKEGKSIVVQRTGSLTVQPAMVIFMQTLETISKFKYYYSIKLNSK